MPWHLRVISRVPKDRPRKKKRRPVMPPVGVMAIDASAASAAILSITETEDGIEEASKERESESKQRVLPEVLRNFDRNDDHDDDIHERYEQ